MMAGPGCVELKRRAMSRVGLLVVLMGVLAGVTASERRSLSGTYRIGGATFYDPPSEEPQDTHLYVELTGIAARDLYEAMAVTPKVDECTGPNATIKVVDQMQCNRYESGKRHRCWFGVNLRDQKITRGVVC
jgi:hypothetical protein